VLALDHLGKSDVLPYVVETNSDPLSNLGIGNNHDVPAVDFRYPITLLSQTLNLDLTADEVTVDTGNAEPLSLPFDVMAKVNGAGHIQGSDRTTVYLDDNLMRAEPRGLETGLSMLRQKVAGICPLYGDDVESFSNHHRDSRTCREAERVSKD
jgi:hypothetical protein